MVDEVIACGINYQGKLIRTALVKVKRNDDSPLSESEGEAESDDVEMSEPKIHIDGVS